MQDDALVQWTIKDCPVRVRDAGVRAAKRAGEKVHVWVERAVMNEVGRQNAEVIQPGKPAGNGAGNHAPKPPGNAVVPIAAGEIAALIHAIAAAEATPGIPKGLLRSIHATADAKLREGRGVPARKPRAWRGGGFPVLGNKETAEFPRLAG